MKTIAQGIGVVLFWGTLIAGLIFMAAASHRGQLSQCEQSWGRHVQVSDQDGMPAGDRTVFIRKCESFHAVVGK